MGLFMYFVKYFMKEMFSKEMLCIYMLGISILITLVAAIKGYKIIAALAGIVFLFFLAWTALNTFWGED